MEIKTLSTEIKVAVIGYGAANNFVKQAINNAIERDTFIALLKACDVTEEEYKNHMNSSMILADNFRKLSDDMKELQEVDYDNSLSIEQLKKQIKYSKNPLEVKMLNKKLNQLYKERSK